MASSFADFMREMEAEAHRAGPAVEAAFFESQQRHWIGRLLAERRRELGYTQTRLAAHSGIHQADISKIERAEANPTLETLAALTTALGCTLALQPVAKGVRAPRPQRRPALIPERAMSQADGRRRAHAPAAAQPAALAGDAAVRAAGPPRDTAAARAVSAPPSASRHGQ